MAWLRLTDTGDHQVMVNMNNILRVGPHEAGSILVTLATGKEGAHTFRVQESPQKIAEFLKAAGEKLAGK